MAQKPQVIDLTKSYLPWDPEAMMANYVSTDREDGEEKATPVIPYEGWNFLPTAYGYKGFFGTNYKFAIQALTSRAQHILLYQGADFKNTLIALCEDGIWMNSLSGSGIWAHEVTVAFDPLVFEEWTWTVIENILYMYHQGESQVYTYEGQFVENPNYMPMVVGGSSTDPAPIISAVALQAGGGTDLAGNGIINYIQVAKIYANGGMGLISAQFSFANNTGWGANATITLNPAATPGDKYRVYAYHEDNPDVIRVQDVTVNGSNQIIHNTIDTAYDFLVDITAGLSTANIKHNYFDLTPTVGINSFLATEVPDVTANAFPVSTYGIYLAQQRQSDLINGVAGYKLPYKLGEITLTQTAFIQVVANLGVTLGAFPEDTYRIFIRDEINATVKEGPGFSGFANLILNETLQYNAAFMTKQLAVVVNQNGTPDFGPAPDFTLGSFSPSFLNMSGQMGIFRASTRLGFWDSANSVAWSSNFDLEDFTPSLENLAGNTIFGDVKGRIVTIKPYGDGFIIYSTKSIVGVSENLEGSMLWDGNSILDEVGIAYSKAVTFGQTDSEHYIFSNQGIFQINGFNAVNKRYPTEPILPDLYDFLKEDRRPVFLTTIGSRYVMFSLIDDKYINGRTTFERRYVHPLVTNVQLSDGYWDGDISVLPSSVDGNVSFQMIKSAIAGNLGGLNTRTQRYWRTRWDGDIVRMDTDVYTNMETLGWVGDLTGYVHPMANKHYANAKAAIVAAVDAETNINFTDASPTIAADGDGFLHAGDYSIPFVDLLYQDAVGGFSTIDEADVGSKLYLQYNEWENFKVTQQATANYIHNKFANAAIDVSEFPKRFLAGDGDIKLLVSSGSQACQMAMRKYFTHEHEVNLLATNEGETITWGAPYQQTGIDTYQYSSMKTLKNAGSGTIQDMGDAITAYLNNFIPPIGAITNITATLSYRIGTLDPQAVGVLQGPAIFSDANRATVQGFLNFQLLFIYQTLAADTNKVLTSLSVQIQFTANGGLDAFYEKFVYQYTFATGSLAFESYYQENAGAILSFYDAISNVTTLHPPKYQVAKVAIENPTYSQADFILKFWDLLEPKVGGGYRLIASYPAATKKRIPFDNLYPDYSGYPAAVQNNHQEFWQMEDPWGNLNVSRIPMDLLLGKFGGYSTGLTDASASAPSVIPGYVIEGAYHPPVTLEFTLPGADFLIQKGGITPLYQDFSGAWVFDTHLKKWGKFAANHKLIVETAPVNTNKDGIISYTNFGTDGGILDAAGNIYVFDSDPGDGYIAYGKIGFYRLGVTHALEAHFDFRLPFTGTIMIDFSMDGRSIDPSLRVTQDCLEVLNADVMLNQRARWAVLKISGNYDLQYLEFRGNIAGRR